MIRNLTLHEVAVLEGSGVMLPDGEDREEEVNRLARQEVRKKDEDDFLSAFRKFIVSDKALAITLPDLVKSDSERNPP